jgi:hypothetical protein
MFWQQMGRYEYEVNGMKYTGWVRCVNGWLADGRWPNWNSYTGATRYR